MSISLRDITADNWEQCIALTPQESQVQFIAPNVYSIAQSKFLTNFYTKGIYSDDTMVGFVMYGLDPDDWNYWVYRLMVDAKHQGKGFGRAGMELAVEHMTALEDCRKIVVAYHPQNEGARQLYAKLGFAFETDAPWGEKMVYKEVRK